MTAVKYNHSEAFCHMLYRSDDGQDEVWIWNSRDGVTPFVITIPEINKSATHADWSRDSRDPEYRPVEGDLIFVNMTHELALRYAQERANEYWTNPKYSAYIESYESVNRLVQILYDSYTDHPGNPALVRIQANGEYVGI